MRKFLLTTAVMAGVATLAATPLSARDRDRDRDDVVRITPNQVVDMADARIAQLKAELRLTPDQDKNWGTFQSALHDMAQRRADRMTRMRDQQTSQADAPATTSTATTTTSAAPAAPGAPIAPAPPVVSDPNPPRARSDRDDRDSRDRDTRDRDSRESRDNRDAAPDIVAEMRSRADIMAARADDFRKFADAAGPLYGSLDDRQKRRFLGFVQNSMLDDPEMASLRGRGRW